MRQVNPVVESGSTRAARLVTCGARPLAPTASSRGGLFTRERWLIALFVLALSGFLFGATALCGLAAMSIWAPTANPSTDRLMPGQAVKTGGFGIRSDRPCCRETQ